jgi:hypothetical protein
MSKETKQRKKRKTIFSFSRHITAPSLNDVMRQRVGGGVCNLQLLGLETPPISRPRPFA